jgi:S1-C subfamily serine protease
VYATENDEAVMVGNLADGGPAEQAGLQVGDRIIAVGEEEVSDLGSLWRRVWACGSAGAEVPVTLGRDEQVFPCTVRSADRASFLKSPRLH